MKTSSLLITLLGSYKSLHRDIYNVLSLLLLRELLFSLFPYWMIPSAVTTSPGPGSSPSLIAYSIRKLMPACAHTNTHRCADEHPEFLPAAREGFGNLITQKCSSGLPQHRYDSLSISAYLGFSPGFFWPLPLSCLQSLSAISSLPCLTSLLSCLLCLSSFSPLPPYWPRSLLDDLLGSVPSTVYPAHSLSLCLVLEVLCRDWSAILMLRQYHHLTSGSSGHNRGTAGIHTGAKCH